MICIDPDVIEKMPNGCDDCPLAFYDAQLMGFFCGITRFDVESARKKHKKHRGCKIFDGNIYEEVEETDANPKSDDNVTDLAEEVVEEEIDVEILEEEVELAEE